MLSDKVKTDAPLTSLLCKSTLEGVPEVPRLEVKVFVVLVWLLAKADVATTVLLAPITAPLSSKVNAGAVKLVLVRVTWLVTVLATAEDLSSLSVTVNLAPSEILAADAPSWMLDAVLLALMSARVAFCMDPRAMSANES